jgi:hypothetical protein
MDMFGILVHSIWKHIRTILYIFIYIFIHIICYLYQLSTINYYYNLISKNMVAVSEYRL